MDGDLWACPECGRRFAAPHQWHSCIELDLAERLDEASDHAVELYRAVEAVIAETGEFRVHPQRSRIAFIDRMTFASVTPARRWVDLGFVTAEPVDDERIRSIEMYGPTTFGHSVRLHAADDVDGDVRRWLAAARRRGRGAPERDDVAPVLGTALERLRIPLASRVLEDGFAVPRWAIEALAAHPEITIRVRGDVLPATFGDGIVVPDTSTPQEMGLGQGDPVDVVLRAAL